MKPSEIVQEIRELLASGVHLEEIHVNDGGAEWGDDGACTREMLESLVEDWQSDGGASGVTADDLPTAEGWARRMGVMLPVATAPATGRNEEKNGH